MGVDREIQFQVRLLIRDVVRRGVYTMQALEQMLHEKSWGEAFLAYFYPKLGGSLF